MLYISGGFRKKSIFWAGLGIIPSILVCSEVYLEQYLYIDSWLFKLLGEKTDLCLGLISKVLYTIGNTYFAGGIVIVALSIMIWRNYKQEAQAFAFATLGILIIVDKILKPFFDRD